MPVTDIVMEGGGVKGLAIAGALQPFGDAGYSFARVGGTSAGALVGAVLAALQQRGEPVSRIEDVARTLDFRRVPDRGFPGRYLGPLAFLADGLALLIEDGAYEGNYMRRWLTGVLDDLGVRTFGDLRTDDPEGDGSIRHRYRLAVTATDLSRHRLVHLPWQYDVYGRDPDEQLVVDAVRASASISRSRGASSMPKSTALTGEVSTATVRDTLHGSSTCSAWQPSMAASTRAAPSSTGPLTRSASSGRTTSGELSRMPIVGHRAGSPSDRSNMEIG